MAKRLSPNGTQTYSKSVERYVDGVYPFFIEEGHGCFVFDDQGRSYIDYVCALGAITLGYAHTGVNEAVTRQLRKGTSFSLPSQLEGQLAEELNRRFPVLERMRFLKSGSEAVSAAVKISRAFTGRDMVLTSGYHGWHDWSTPVTPMNAGTPKSMGQHIIEFQYNDIRIVEALLKAHKVACVVIDPIVYELPKDGYLRKLQKACQEHGAILIFDEVVTGLRWQKESVYRASGVKPDLLCMGKGLANGFPISVVGGRKDVMSVLEKDCFISSTFGGDLVGITAAIATLRIAKDEGLHEKIHESGWMFKESYNDLAERFQLDSKCIGNPARLKITFPTDEHRALFWQECMKRGLFLGYAHHTNLSHTDNVIAKSIRVINDSLFVLAKYWENPKAHLEGKPPVPVLRR